MQINRALRVVLAAGAALLAIGAAMTDADAAVVITVDKSIQTMTVAVDGVTRWQWPVSTGRPGYNTPSGSFRAFRMEADHFSKEWDDAPMPFSIFFTRQGHAIHGYLDTRHIGVPASHGCVRLDPRNAAALFDLVRREGLQQTTVVLTGHATAASRSPLIGAVASVAPPALPPREVAPPAAAAGPLPLPFFFPFRRDPPY